jgi:hypothetical protein
MRKIMGESSRKVGRDEEEQEEKKRSCEEEEGQS